jgi:hypothetical protein
MTDSVDIDDAAVTAAITALRTRATTWAGHGTGLSIDGVGSGVRTRTDEAVTAWKTEFATASTAVGLLATGVQTDLDAFDTLDSSMASPSPDLPEGVV